MARKGDIKVRTAPVSIREVRHEVPVTIVHKAADDTITPVDYSDMTATQLRGIASEFHVTAVICRTCGDEAPHCPDVAKFFA